MCQKVITVVREKNTGLCWECRTGRKRKKKGERKNA